jgi:DNA-directed RNA polymerase subunit M/transcription elongation factor TFIIS
MYFCKKCGKRLESNEINLSSGVISCKKCGYSQKTDLEEIKRYLLHRKINSPPELVVMENEIKLSTVNVVCPYCGWNRAYYREIPPVWGDEDGLIIYTCEKCKKSWREGWESS